MKFCLKTLGALLIVAGMNLAHGDTITLINPGFEDGPAETGAGFDVGPTPGSIDVPGWTNIDGAAIYTSSGVGDSNPLTVHSGSWAAFFNSNDPGAYQLTPYVVQAGDQFTLTWWAVSNGFGSQTVSLFTTPDVFVNANTAATYGDSSTFTTSTYTQYSLLYTATGADAGKFLGVAMVNQAFLGSPGGWNNADDFALNVTPGAAVPEPGTWALLLMACGGFWGVRRFPGRRRES